MTAPADDDDRIDGDTIDFASPQRHKPKRRIGLYAVLGLFFLVVGGAAGAWLTIDYWWPEGEDGETPLIRAKSGPLKVRPDDPGGMSVPNQDKLIYERMGAGGLPPEPEQLLPGPERPLAPPRRAPAAEAAMPLPPPPAVVPAVPMAPTTAPRAVVAAPIPARPPTTPVPSAPATPDEVEAVTPPAPAPPPPLPQTAAVATTPKAAGAYKVQVVAVRSPEAAQREWDRIRQRNMDLLNAMELTVTKVDLGPGKGIYYRLRAGPLADEAAAKKLCDQLDQRKVGCLVVRPGG